MAEFRLPMLTQISELIEAAEDNQLVSHSLLRQLSYTSHT